MYTVDYFLQLFSAIPENRWLSGTFTDGVACCANGHLGARFDRFRTGLTEHLQKVFEPLKIHGYDGCELEDGTEGYSDKAAYVNNGKAREYQQPTPKQRILAALHDIKKMQTKDIDTGGKEEKKERIVYVSVPVSITEQSKDLVLS